MGASASPSGSRATHETPTGSHPSGFDPSRIIALTGDRYSPNLRKFLRKRDQRAYRTRVYRDAEKGWLYIGQQFDDGWFHGAQLMRVLCVGSKAETWAFEPKQLSLTLIENFWPTYERIGRCAIDTTHDQWWMHEETRWQTDGDTRSCLWCGEHTQRLRRWTETVERERWEPAQGTEARRAETAQTGSVHDGPVAKPCAHNNPSSSPSESK